MSAVWLLCFHCLSVSVHRFPFSHFYGPFLQPMLELPWPCIISLAHPGLPSDGLCGLANTLPFFLVAYYYF